MSVASDADLENARASAAVAEDAESRALPGSPIDMKRHWADYRGFVAILRLAVGFALLTLAVLAYVLT